MLRQSRELPNVAIVMPMYNQSQRLKANTDQ